MRQFLETDMHFLLRAKKHSKIKNMRQFLETDMHFLLRAKKHSKN